MNKREIRQKMIQKRRTLSEAEILNAENKILIKLKEIVIHNKPKVIFIYIDFNDEVPTRSFIRWCLNEGIIVCVPKCVKRDGLKYMLSVRIKDLDELKPGMYGIPEPEARTEDVVERNDVDIAIMPGVAFGLGGERVGYGAGWYDSYLENISRKMMKLAICYDFQIVDSAFKTEEHDVNMDVVLSENRIISGNKVIEY